MVSHLLIVTLYAALTALCNCYLTADSYAHRTAVRKALAQDKDWIEKCFSKILPMFASQVSLSGILRVHPQPMITHCVPPAQTNVMMKPFPWCSLQLEPSQSTTGKICWQNKQ